MLSAGVLKAREHFCDLEHVAKMTESVLSANWVRDENQMRMGDYSVVEVHLECIGKAVVRVNESPLSAECFRHSEQTRDGADLGSAAASRTAIDGVVHATNEKWWRNIHVALSAGGAGMGLSGVAGLVVGGAVCPPVAAAGFSFPS